MTKPDFNTRAKLVAAAIARHPGEFGLRAFPGKKFRVSQAASYWGDSAGEVMLFTQCLRDTGWIDFAKGTEDELNADKVRL